LIFAEGRPRRRHLQRHLPDFGDGRGRGCDDRGGTRPYQGRVGDLRTGLSWTSPAAFSFARMIPPRQLGSDCGTSWR
jgi:hypothetical protein